MKLEKLKLSFLAQILFVFLTASFFSFLVANSMLTGKVAYTDKSVKSVYVPPQSPFDKKTSGYPYEPAKMEITQFLVSFFIATVLMLLFLQIFKGKFLFEILLSSAVIFGAQGLLGIFFSKVNAFIISILIVLVRFLYPRIWTQNFAVIIGISGISASLGMSIEPVLAALLLIILSMYDFIAVYKTRHMVKLFKDLAKRGVMFAVVIPKSFFMWNKRFEVINKKNKDKFVFLGTGDIALPLFFAVSSFTAGIKFYILIVFGAVVGIIADHLIFIHQKDKKPIPALPAITFFSVIGYIIGFYL